MIKRIMATNFDINAGLLSVLRGLISNENFARNILDMLLGRQGSAEAVGGMMRRQSYTNTLNEVVAIHRLLKCNLNEGLLPNNGKDMGLLRQLMDVRRKSSKFQSAVIAKTLKKPGAVRAVMSLVKTKGADPQAWSVLVPMVLDSAQEVAAEDEEMEVSLSERMRMPSVYDVNIMIGRFQPFTLGHLKCLKAVKDNLGVPTLLCVIPGNGDDKHPFMGDIQDEMYERLKEAYPDLFADVRYVKNAFIESWVMIAQEEKLTPVCWTCGTDRKDAYQVMVDKFAEKYGLPEDFKVYCLDRADDNISATSVRECLVNGDREGFNRQMPPCLHDMFDKMRQVMVGDRMPAVASKLQERRK